MSESELIRKITEEVVRRLKAEDAGTGGQPAAGVGSAAGGAGAAAPGNPADAKPILPSELAPYIHHTLLKPDATQVQIDKLCEEAVKHGFASVCVNTTWAAHCARKLRGSGVKVAVVGGFPLGAMSGRSKGFEARHAIEDGAREIDMVMNIGALKSGHLALVEEDIRHVRRACGRNVVLKVILETSLLTDDEKITACRIAQKAEADFVKTSTGFSTGGATVEDVALMRRTVGPRMGVKASGGIRTYEDAVRMIRAGASRIGASASVAIVTGGGGTAAY